MKFSDSEPKRNQVIAWVKMFRRSVSRVIVSDYSYSCYFSGNRVTKTLVVIPDEIEHLGIIAIDKALDQIEMPDIIKLGKRITVSS